MGSTATRIVAMVMLGIAARCHDPPQRSMESFIAAVEQVEAWNPELKGVALLRSLRGWGAGRPSRPTLPGPPQRGGSPHAPFRGVRLLPERDWSPGHRGREEEGVVLTQDGTTVALAPLILGLEAGLLAGEGSHLSGVYALALAQTLGLSFLRSPLPDSLGPDGCWDNRPERPPVLSGLLRRYYQHRLRDGGLGSAPRLISPRRRQNFRELVSPALLREQVREALALRRRLAGDPALAQGAETEAAALGAGLELFVRRYTECPAIIPRCQWEAEPYRGTPTLLALPLSFLYVHHTYGPSRPCLTFQQCAADMRSMQRFHQDDRGWDDIGYSFVAGSDGYIYEGRGWNWRGAHTKGQNSRGYGVSIIGDYTTDLPSRPTLELVRDQLTACAVGGDRLIANYTVHGHRQLVNTSCPGDALFSEIQGWAHFREVQP
ncbi:hypothetical protein ANANG_G00296960 [Anguilla anguilla]|uniref:Peptidoglycan recognition protein 2 n=1 Tax=Anguilla anguilla TaxID=7936 RepID=A0A9D3LPW9_ANGAN|nr:hypothetical protein ANANG_G00296960 [Anguilla anguilla]